MEDRFRASARYWLGDGWNEREETAETFRVELRRAIDASRDSAVKAIAGEIDVERMNLAAVEDTLLNIITIIEGEVISRTFLYEEPQGGASAEEIFAALKEGGPLPSPASRRKPDMVIGEEASQKKELEEFPRVCADIMAAPPPEQIGGGIELDPLIKKALDAMHMQQAADMAPDDRIVDVDIPLSTLKVARLKLIASAGTALQLFRQHRD